MWNHRAEVALGGLFVLVWWLVPPLLYRRMAAGPDAQLKAITDTRTALLAGLVGLGALLTFQLSSRAGQNAVCYSKAIEQLTSDKLEMRLSGLYVLEHLAKDSARDHPMVVEVLSGFVRVRSDPAAVLTTRNTMANGRPAAERQPDARQPQTRSNLTTDLRAALTVLGRLPCRPNVDRADLSNARLTASRSRNDAVRLWTHRGRPGRADLVGVDLTRAKLEGVNLTEVLGLTWEQLDLAVFNLETRLGPELETVEEHRHLRFNMTLFLPRIEPNRSSQFAFGPGAIAREPTRERSAWETP